MLRKTLKLLAALVIIMMLFSLVNFYISIRPMRIVSVDKPSDFGLNFEKVAFTTTDGVLIKGWFIANKNPRAHTIILLHGYPTDKGDILSGMRFLHQQFNLLFFDFRYMGESSGAFTTIGASEVLDLQAAIKFLKNRGINKVGVWGFSLGGAVALLAAPSTPEIEAIVAETPYARLDWMAESLYPIPIVKHIMTTFLRIWGLLFLHLDISNVNPVDSLNHINIPVLLIFSKSDQLISYKHALAMQAVAKDKTNIKFIIQDNLGHGRLIKNHEKIVDNFFLMNLH